MILAGLLVPIIAVLFACTHGNGSGTTIPETFFGMHVQRLAPDPGNPATPWPSAPVGSIRLWDSGTTWSRLQPTPTTWNWTSLDAQVDAARSHGAEVTLVLGQTPTWASARPGVPSPYGAGASAEPASMTVWQNYVSEVATRYRGRISSYEIWNEPVEATYYTGTPEMLGTMTKLAVASVKAADAQALVISAAPYPKPPQNTFLRRYLANGVGQSVDVIGLHLYSRVPEVGVENYQVVQKALADLRLDKKPVWITETGYRKPKDAPYGDVEARGILARTFLLLAGHGVGRVYWYAWDNQQWVGLRLTKADSTTPTAAGAAYVQIRRALLGARLVECTSSPTDTSSCDVERNGAKSRFYWFASFDLKYNATILGRTKRVVLPPNATGIQPLGGAWRPARGGAWLDVGLEPVQVTLR